MEVDQKVVRKVAKLARIKVSAEDVTALEAELSAILSWVEQLNEVDTDNIEPMTSVEDIRCPQRLDEVTDGGYAEIITGNAPKQDDHYFVVPKVVE